MPKKATKPTYESREYDSQEEIEFQIFLNEAESYGLILSQKYQPGTYTLAPKAYRSVTKHFKTKPDRVEQKTLFQSHVYTPDWHVIFAPSFFEVFPKHKLFVVDETKKEKAIDEPPHTNPCSCLIDVKGGWNLHGGDRLLPIHQKLMWHINGEIVNKVVPQEFFKRIGVVPCALKWMKNRKTKTPKKAYKFVDTFQDKAERGELGSTK